MDLDAEEGDSLTVNPSATQFDRIAPAGQDEQDAELEVDSENEGEEPVAASQVYWSVKAIVRVLSLDQSERAPETSPPRPCFTHFACNFVAARKARKVPASMGRYRSTNRKRLQAYLGKLTFPYLSPLISFALR